MPSSPAIAARPGFNPGGPPQRFGFNPNMPPPGFRMPPPGFGIRPIMPGVPNNTADTPNKDTPPVQKQPEMAWPPDSNEKDEDDDEMNESSEKPADSSPFKPAFGNPPSAPVPPGTESALRMLGPPPPGFPPGPPGSPWSMRFGGPRQMRPLGGMPPMGGDNPDMFNSLPPLMGPRGPRFMGFPRGPMMRPMRPPSLLELDIKPPENFEGEKFDKEEEEEEEKNEEENNNSDNEDNWKSGNDAGGSNYPHNSWQSARDSRDRNHDRSHRDEDRNRDRGSRNRDRDRDRDRGDSRNRDRDRDRNWDRDREDRHRDRDRRDSRDRDRGRGDRDRDWRKNDDGHDNREGRSDRKEERERDRPRRSRWSNIEDTKESEEIPKEIVTESVPETLQPVEDQPQPVEAGHSEPTPTEVPVDNSDNVTDTNTDNMNLDTNAVNIMDLDTNAVNMDLDTNTVNMDLDTKAVNMDLDSNAVNMDLESNDMDLETPAESVSVPIVERTDIEERPAIAESSGIEEKLDSVVPETQDNGGLEDTQAPQAEEQSVCDTNTNDNDTEAEFTPSANGPITDNMPSMIPSSKLDNDIQSEPLIEPEGIEENGEIKERNENLDLEEGEISS